MKADNKVVVIGAGISGAAAARTLAERGKKVLLVEKNDHVGGSVYDYVDDGIIVQAHGPHIFHTDDFDVFKFLSKFTQWQEYDHRVSGYIDGKFVPLPFNLTSLSMLRKDSESIERKLVSVYGLGKSVSVGALMRSSDATISEFGRFVYEKVFSYYTLKQWGSRSVPDSVLDRVPVKICYQHGYFDDRYIYQPVDGFTAMIEKMLSHPNIELKLSCDGKELIDVGDEGIKFEGEVCPVVFSGRIDELFNYKYGKLLYRTLDFKFERYDIQSFQPTAVVNYTQSEDYTRISEFTKFTSKKLAHTIIVKEYPRDCNGNDTPYYPICDQIGLIGKYFAEAKRYKNLTLIGRLGLHKYVNMDEAVIIAIKGVSGL